MMKPMDIFDPLEARLTSTAPPEHAILPGTEQEQIVMEWNATHRDYPTGKRLHQLFEEQVERTPHAIAVSYQQEHLTYRELNGRANQLAHHLVRLGVGPEKLVGICMERSVSMVVGVLGILKAGGAYVPLDPQYPQERIAFMLQDAHAQVLLTQQSLVGTLPLSDSEVRVVCLDTEGEGIEAEGEDDPQIEVSDTNLAYVIYTSGSTGIPKGVLIEHHSAVTFVHWAVEAFSASEMAGVLACTSLCFDLSVFELFATLSCGGRVILADNLLQAPALFDEGLQITLINTVPSLMLELIRQLKRRGETTQAVTGEAEIRLPACVQTVNLAGEPLTADLVEQVYSLLDRGERRVLNLYGPTEDTTYSTFAVIERGKVEPTLATKPPIGRPIANTQAYILDEMMQPVPPGVVGELYLGGNGLARGYLHRPDFTASRFVPNPFSSIAGERVYKTGDLVRYLPNSNGSSTSGTIEYVGRVGGDGQVKLWGLRIELGEIEAALRTHPAVQDVVVSVRQVMAPQQSADTGAGANDKRLVAYVVFNEVSEDTGSVGNGVEAYEVEGDVVEELRSYMRKKLPEYMVPWRFLALHSLPLTPNGKVDRKALPNPIYKPDLDVPSEGREEPGSEIEEMIADIWGEVLGIERAEIRGRDNFFMLGGHSLLAMQVVSRIRETLEIELPLRTIFDTPTVAGLALAATATLQRNEGLKSQLPAIERVPRQGPMTLSFAQEQIWFFEQLEPGTATYNLPFGLYLTGALDIGALERSLNEVVNRHEVLRTGFAAVQGLPVQIISPHFPLSSPIDSPDSNPSYLRLSVVDLCHYPPAERQAHAQDIIADLARQPFDLPQPPLLRATLLRLGQLPPIGPSPQEQGDAGGEEQEEHALVLVMHHIVSDGWSTQILLEEVDTLYRALTPSATPLSNSSPLAVLPVLPIQYADYAAWQRQWLQGPALDAQLTYWRQQLVGSSLPTPAIKLAPLQLPTDRPRPPVQTYRGAKQWLSLPRRLKERVAQVSRQEGVTPFMTLLAAYQTLLYRYTAGQPGSNAQISVGTAVANRNRAELEGLIGLFVNTLVMRTDLSGNPTFRELLKRVKEVTLGAYSHQDVPFEKLVAELQPQRDPSHNPLFQVMFQFQSSETKTVEDSGLSVSPFIIETGTAKFDLTLDIIEEPDGLVAVMEYNTGLFNKATVARMLTHFGILLENLLDNLDYRLSDAPLLTEDEQQELRKVRAEAEAALRLRPGVREVMVIANGDLPGGNRLVACVILDQQQSPTAGELGSYLIERLPEYQAAIPILFRDALPPGINGDLSYHSPTLFNELMAELQAVSSQDMPELRGDESSGVSAREEAVSQKRGRLSSAKLSLLEKRLRELRSE